MLPLHNCIDGSVPDSKFVDSLAASDIDIDDFNSVLTDSTPGGEVLIAESKAERQFFNIVEFKLPGLQNGVMPVVMPVAMPVTIPLQCNYQFDIIIVLNFENS